MSHHRLHLAIAIAVAGSLLWAPSARAERLRRVGVVVTLAVNAPKAENLASTLGEALREKLVVDVIAGEDARRRLPDGGIPKSCVAEPACIDDIAGRLDADELLMLVVVRVGDRVQIDSTWVDVASKRAVSRPAIAISTGKEEPKAVLAAAAPDLLPDAPRRPPSASGSAGVIAGGEVIESPPAPAGSGRRMTTAVWVTGGAAGLTLAGGIGVGLAARAKYKDLEGCGGSCPQGDLDSLRRLNLTADILLGTAVICAGTAAMLYYLSDGEPSDEAAIAASPSVTADGTFGLAVGGVF